MERHERFAADLDAATETGVSGPGRMASRSPWRKRDAAPGFDTGTGAVHERLAVAAARLLSQPIETGFTPCPVTLSVSDISTVFHARGVPVARLALSAGVADQLMSRRFGGAMAMADPVICDASRPAVMLLLDQLADEFRTMWLEAGVDLVRDDGKPDSFAAAAFDYALQLGGGQVRIRYAAGFGGQPASSGSAAMESGLDATRIQVTAVVAQPSVTLRAFAALTEGAVIPLGPCDGVTLVAGDRLIGTGVLVAIGAQRGILLSILSGPAR